MNAFEKFFLLMLIVMMVVLSTLSDVVYKWDVNTQDEPPVRRQLSLFTGETLKLQPRFIEGARPSDIPTNSPVFLMYRPVESTNWYMASTSGLVNRSNKGEVSVLFTPFDDVGGSNILFHIGANFGGLNYRAFGNIIRRGSPPTILSTNTPIVVLTEELVDSKIDVAIRPLVTTGYLAVVLERQEQTNTLFTVWLAGISGRTNLWNEAWAWGNHALAGYAGTEMVAAVAADLAALTETVANLPMPTFDRVIATDDPSMWLGVTASNAVLFKVEEGSGWGWWFGYNVYGASWTGRIDETYMTYPLPETFGFSFPHGSFSCLTDETYDRYTEINFVVDENYATWWGSPSLDSATVFEGDGGTAILYPVESATTTNIIKTLASTDDLADALTAYYTAADIDGIIANLPAPTAPTPSIIRPVFPSAATVAVTSTQVVYSVSLSSPSTVTQNVSALGLNGTSEASWKLLLDLTTTNALTSTIAGVTFDSQPEFTVTGRYEFAMSSLDGVRVQAKQTWPETYVWSRSAIGAPNANFLTAAHIFNRVSTNGYFLCERTCLPCPSLIEIRYINPGAGGPVKASITTADFVNFATGPTETNLTVASNPAVVRFALPSAITANATAYRVSLFRLDGAAFGDWAYLLYVAERPLNALERAAYAAGWRP